MDQIKSPATLKDVASAAGVSISCVSVVLNGTRSGTRVSDKTRSKVMECAARLGYRPNAIGRSLQRRRTQAIGFYSAQCDIDAGNTFLAELIGGMQEGCQKRDLALLLYNLHKGAGLDMSLQRLSDGYVDGLLVYGSSSNPVVGQLVHSHMPIVAIVDPIPGLPSVRIDDWRGGEAMAKELSDLGYERVLYRQPSCDAASVKDRTAAFANACSILGIEVTMGRNVHAHSGVEFSTKELEWLEGMQETHSAIAVWEDLTAVATMAQLRDMGVRIPEDVGVTGYNGSYTGPWPTAPLTTIRAPWREVAFRAVDLLVSQIEGESVEPTTILPVQFVRGTTTQHARPMNRSTAISDAVSASA
jgi:DNA-binding LacI/PurR family transcriptional regulator